MKQIFTLLFILSSLVAFSQTTADFETITIEADSFLNGSDGNNGFSNGNIFLPNDYNSMWDSWIGWAISNKTDVTTAGFTNQFSAITGSGFDNSTNYAVGFISGSSIIKLEGMAAGEMVNGMYITNGTYTYLSMKDGDSFAKKFGGATGDDPDYYFLTIKKYLNGELSTDSIDFYLADFRDADNTNDYIINEWTYLDLTPLGQADSLIITASSSDVGQFGINTPTYFCMDNFTTSDGTVATNDLFDENLIDIYPNPAADFFFVNNEEGQLLNCSIFDMNGRRIYNNTFADHQKQVNISHLNNGIYTVVVESEGKFGTRRLIKK